MENIHRLLQRQLKRYRKEQDIPCDWMEFLQVVNEVYHESDADRRMLEHSLEISSKELLEANLELRNNAEILLEQQAFSEKAQEAGHIGSWIADVDSSGKIFWSKGVYRIFGIDEKDFNGKEEAFFAFIHPDDLKNVKDAIRMAVSDEKSYNIDYRIVHRDGNVRWVYAQADVTRDAAGKVVKMIGIVQDVTERKKMEDELKDSNKDLVNNERAMRHMLIDLKKTNDDLKNTQGQLFQSEKLASIGQLAAGVAHEINNPVGFIGNNMEMLEQYVNEYIKIIKMAENLQKSVEEENMEQAKSIVKEMVQFEKEIDLDQTINDIKNLLKHTQNGIERIRKVVLDLRTFSREGVDTMEMIKVEEIIESIISITSNEIKYKAELKKSYGDTPMVNCSAQRVGQVFINLLVNAAQAMEKKGIIEIRTYQQDGYVCIDVIDSGKGIEEKNLKKVFDPFYTTKPVGQGTGLGLSVSYEIIKKHGGELNVRSKVGEGTTFTVMLPLAKGKG